jgi:hypothetical protein
MIQPPSSAARIEHIRDPDSLVKVKHPAMKEI